MKKKELKGVICALATPLSSDGERIDEAGLRSHVDVMVDAGVHVILAVGGTGEFAVLSPTERRRVIESVVKQTAGRAHVLAQTSAISTTDAIECAKHAESVGADSLMILPPYFEGPTMEGTIRFYERIAKSVRIPIMCYNIPQHTGIDITPDIYARLLEIDGITSIKDSTGNMMRIQELVAVGGDVFPGADPLTPFCFMAGCKGVVWGGANIAPRESVQLYDLIMAKRYAEALKLWERLFPINLYLWRQKYNAAVKAATNLMGMKVGPCRQPVLPLTATEMKDLKKALKPLGYNETARLRRAAE